MFSLETKTIYLYLKHCLLFVMILTLACERMLDKEEWGVSMGLGWTGYNMPVISVIREEKIGGLPSSTPYWGTWQDLSQKTKQNKTETKTNKQKNQKGKNWSLEIDNISTTWKIVQQFLK